MKSLHKILIFIMIFPVTFCRQNEDLTHLYKAVRSGDIESVRELSIKADVNEILKHSKLKTDNIRLYENENTALHEAVILNHFEICLILIDAGADINAGNKTGTTPLMLAAQLGHTEILELLIESGAGINQRDSEGNTAFMYAAFKGNINSMDVLLNNDANINSVDNSGNTVLIWSVKYRNSDKVKILIQKGASVSVRNYAGKTAFDFARDNHDNTILSLLKSAKKE